MATLRSDASGFSPSPATADAIRRAFDVALVGYQRQYRTRRATYISVPITTGPRYFEALQRRREFTPPFMIGYSDLESEVVRPNLADARDFIARINPAESVIDPTAVLVPGARQEDYYSFWRRVLQSVVSCLITGPGWQFSFGCIAEVAAALDFEVPITCDGQLLTARAIAEAIHLADSSLVKRGFTASLLISFWYNIRSSARVG